MRYLFRQQELKKMKIQKLTNNRLYYSEDEFYRVNIDIVTEFQLKKNMIIDGQTEKKLLIELLLFRAYGFLIKRDYTEKEIRNKLRMEFPKEAPYDELIEKLKEKSYLDDYSFAKNFIEIKNFSKKKVYYELTMRGIKKEYIDSIYSEVEVDEKEQIEKYMRKLESKDERKKIEYLLRKGYNLKDILEVIKENKK